MTFIPSVKTLTIALGATLCAWVGASAQVLKLPETHREQHSALLANQRPFEMKNAFNNELINDVEKREALEDNDIFTKYWASQSVNPYGNIAIPATKDIDVSDYVSPIPGRVTSPYGWRKRFGRMHRGVDISLRVGDTVRAAFSGKVRLTKFEKKGYGYYVVLRHDNGMETVYGHLSRFLVKPNQRVEAGQPIALGGNTGRSTGPHLHFETRYLGLAINPEAIIDFANGVTHKDTFTFSKLNYDKSQQYGPKRSGKNTRASATKKASSKKKGAAKKNTKRRRR